MTGRNINSNLGFLFEQQGKQVVYVDTLKDSFSGTFTGSLSGNFIGTTIANGTFSGNFLGNGSGTFTGSHLGNFTGTFSGSASGSFTGSFKGYVSGTLLFSPVSFAATHKIPVTASSPTGFNGPPIGFIPYYASSASFTVNIENYNFSQSISLNKYFITIDYAAPYGNCRVKNSAAVSIPHNSVTAVTFNSAEQSGNISWAVGDPTKLVCAVGGRVSIGTSGLFTLAAGGWRESYARINGASTYAYDLTPGGTYAGFNR